MTDQQSSPYSVVISRWMQQREAVGAEGRPVCTDPIPDDLDCDPVDVCAAWMNHGSPIVGGRIVFDPAWLTAPETD